MWFHSLCKWLAWHFSGGPCCTVFSFRWFVPMVGFRPTFLFGHSFLRGQSGGISPGSQEAQKKCTTWQLAHTTSHSRGINRTLQYLSLNTHTTTSCLHQRGKKVRKERACPKNEGRCFPVPTGSIQGRIHNSARCCKARTRGRDLQALGRFPPPLFQYLKPTCSHTSPSHYYHALQSWTPRHGTSTFTSPCLATTPPDMASYACLIYILASSC